MAGPVRGTLIVAGPLPAPDPLDAVPGMVPAAAFADLATLPDVLSAMLADLDRAGVTSLAVCRSLAQHLAAAPPYLAAALCDVAAAADASGHRNAYHNPAHSRDIGVVFTNLMRLGAALAGKVVDAVDLLTGCCAAFGHDIGHDGRDSLVDTPFRLEEIAADRVGAIMDAHAVEPYLIDRVHCAIMATEVRSGYRALDEARSESLSADTPGCLRTLATNRRSREVAGLLRDADVLQSAGLTPADHDRQTARLERERGLRDHAMGSNGADFFLRDLIRGRFLSQAGQVFQPRLDRLLHLNALRAAQGRTEEGLAAIDARDREETGAAQVSAT